MTRLLKKIKTNLHIASFRKAVGVLEGEYLALTRGRSLDFEDLREYVPGVDAIRDIDWRTTARSAKPLVKKFVSTKQQAVNFIVDTGRGMEALSDSGHRKKDIIIQVMGLLGFLSIKHHDPVGLIYGNHEEHGILPPREGEARLERALHTVYQNTHAGAPVSNIENLLAYASKVLRKRGIAVIITGDFPISAELTTLVKQLQKTQELLWILVKDGDPLMEPDANSFVEDIETFELIPEFIRSNVRLHAWFHEEENFRSANYIEYMKQQRVGYAEVGDPNEVVFTLIKMLEGRKREQRRR